MFFYTIFSKLLGKVQLLTVNIYYIPLQWQIKVFSVYLMITAKIQNKNISFICTEKFHSQESAPICL